MIEIERKFRLTPAKKAELKAILQHQYGKVESIRQIDEIFLSGIDSFEDFKWGDPVVRLRIEGNTTKLAYKRQINDSGDSLEHELIVGSADTMRAILLAMGYRLVTKVDKMRTEITAESLTVALDTVKQLGDFLEIEIIAKDESNTAKHEARIMATAAKFGLTKADIEPMKYDMLMNSSR